MTDKPTGVFVRLPLSNEQLGKLLAPIGPLNERLLAIGTPLTGGELYPIGYINEDAIGGLATGIYQSASIFREEDAEHHDTVALTRHGIALAKLAERDAEIVLHREALRMLLADWEDCMGDRPSIGSNAARKALKGLEV